MIMAEETRQDLSAKGSAAKLPLKGETYELGSESVESSQAVDTQVRKDSLMSEGSNKRGSQISDTESMDRGQDDEEYDDDVEPDSIPSSFGSGFATTIVHKEDSFQNTFNQTSKSMASVSETEREPLTVAQQITEMYERRRQSEEADFLKTMDKVSILEQEMEMLSLQNKDLMQQVKLLKEENDHLRSTSSCVEDKNRQVKQLQENLRQAVERMYHYQSRCEKFEILQAERVQAGPQTMCATETCNSPPSTEKSEEPDTMAHLQNLSLSIPGLCSMNNCSDDKVDKMSEQKEEEEEEDSHRK